MFHNILLASVECEYLSTENDSRRSTLQSLPGPASDHSKFLQDRRAVRSYCWLKQLCRAHYSMFKTFRTVESGTREFESRNHDSLSLVGSPDTIDRNYPQTHTVFSRDFLHDLPSPRLQSFVLKQLFLCCCDTAGVYWAREEELWSSIKPERIPP